MIPWSYSRLNDFETCPKLFHEKHILKSIPYDDTSPHLIKGRDYHEKLERAVKQVIETGGGGFPKEIHHMVPMIQNLVRYARGTGEAQFLTEQQRALTEDHKETGWFGDDVWVRVIWDWLILTNYGTAIVVDWKTGKPWPDGGQLKLFAGAAMACFPEIDVVSTAYVYVEHNKVVKEQYFRADYDAIWDEFGERSELIQLANESGSWPAKPSQMACKFCKAKCEEKY